MATTVYFSISLCSLIAAIVIGIVKLRWQMLFPILYTILVGYYFQRQVLEAYPPREVDDILFTMRAPWCLLSLFLMAVKDGLTCAFTSVVFGEGEKPTTDSTAPSEGTPSDG